MLTVATLLWDPNQKSFPFSRYYDETWVEKLYRGFARNLTVPFQFRVFTDRPREFEESAVKVSKLKSRTPGYDDCIQPFEIGEPMILCGLDTVILRNIDHLAHYCLTQKVLALPRDPYHWGRACNGVVLAPAGLEQIYTSHAGQNDMDWLRSHEHVFIDDVFPGSVKSYKGHVMGETGRHGGGPATRGYAGIDICYFHGEPKPHRVVDPEITENWR